LLSKVGLKIILTALCCCLC